jgi:hypothetical protein
MSHHDDDSTPPLATGPGPYLDFAEIGAALVRLAPISAQLGHARPRSTMRDYVDRDLQSPEGQFVHDVLTQPTEVVCDRWYGGVKNAQALAVKMLGL